MGERLTVFPVKPWTRTFVSLSKLLVSSTPTRQQDPKWNALMRMFWIVSS